MQDFEKLGAFYLGRLYDLNQRQIKDELLLYDAKDLTTHGMCVGMTGSGKTGLCISLLEEAAIDSVPTLAVDPKGDLGNLMLTFPGLQASDFRPWIDESEAARRGSSPEAYAKRMATVWKNGLAEWGEDGDRISSFRDSVDITIYTPGSRAGIPVSVLKSFDAPPPEVSRDLDALKDRVQTSVSGILTLLGINGDPIRSREHILLSNILNQAWLNGQNLDLPNLIRQIQTPRFDKIGVFDLESFYSQDERFELAMCLNNLLASPGFSSWLEGEPLDIGKLLYTRDGHPRISIMSIAHLSEQERMFFVTMLLNELLSWARTQSGTSSLRALFYMDEIFGYFPPTANPPSKQPMLTLLKQARAYGLGVLLSTQNPVDLDYKGLSNIGTWFLGRLQTERDKVRVLDGLEGASVSASANFNRNDMETVLSGLGSRVFLMHNVHEDGPQVFHTRWALSYLRGPLTRTQIQLLTEAKKAQLAPPTTSHTTIPKSHTHAVPLSTTKAEPVIQRPVVPPQINEFFLGLNDGVGDSTLLVYRPKLLATAKLHYVRATAKVDTWETRAWLIDLPDTGTDLAWDGAIHLVPASLDIEHLPNERGTFSELPASATNKNTFRTWKKELKTFIYQENAMDLLKSGEFRLYSKPNESEGEFRGRLSHVVNEKRDMALEKLRRTYGRRLETIQNRVQRAEQKIERETTQYKQQKFQTAISIGTTLIGAVFGRKKLSSRNISRAATAARGAGRSASAREDIAIAEEELLIQQNKLMTLEEEFEQALLKVEGKMDPTNIDLDILSIAPRKSDIAIQKFGLVWTPWKVLSDGIAEPIFHMASRP